MSLNNIELGNDRSKQTDFYIQIDINFCHLRITHTNDIYSTNSSDVTKQFVVQYTFKSSNTDTFRSFFTIFLFLI